VFAEVDGEFSSIWIVDKAREGVDVCTMVAEVIS
jgi:hypothetical protein